MPSGTSAVRGVSHSFTVGLKSNVTVDRGVGRTTTVGVKSSKPAVGEFTEVLYGNILPVTHDDDTVDWHLLRFTAAIGEMVQPIWDLVSDTADDPSKPGWSVVMDLDRVTNLTPDVNMRLKWLAQFIGAIILDPAILTLDQKKDVIKNVEGMSRGTLSAMISVMNNYLTGTKKIFLRERQGSAYQIEIKTLASETPDAAKILQAILTQKPAGLVLNYATLSGNDYLTLRTDFASYTTVKNNYPTYTGVLQDVP